MSDMPLCSHLLQIKEIIQPKEQVCEECIKTNSIWVHLRTCQTCGKTLCCDQSPNRHMTAHYVATHHPVVISAQPDEKWMYCYEDDQFADYQ